MRSGPLFTRVRQNYFGQLGQLRTGVDNRALNEGSAVSHNCRNAAASACAPGFAHSLRA